MNTNYTNGQEIRSNGAKQSETRQQYDILVEQSGDKYLARVLAWADCTVEGNSREEAIAFAHTAILERLAKNEVVTIDVTTEQINNPWLKFAGTWADDPTYDEFLEEVESYRKELDAERDAEWEKMELEAA